MDRRQFLASGGVAALATTVLPSTAFAQSTGDTALNAEFERIFQKSVARSPELATSLGLDKGPLTSLKSQLSPRTPEKRARDVAETKASIASLARYDGVGLSPAAKLNLEVVRYSLNTQIAAPETFGMDSPIRPYRIFQQGGAYFQVPDFLNTAHTINATPDAEAYLSRLDQFGTVLDQESAMQQAEATRGLLAPGWSLDLTLGQMRKLRGQPAATSSIVQSLVKRAAAKGRTGDWQARAAKIVDEKVYPALDRQIALIERMKPTTKPGDGIWRVPTQPLEIRAVPVEIQDGAANGYYNRASLDGSRPAIYFVNLKDVGDWPKYTLPSLTYHEGVPGHHLQISLAQESKDIPTLRKIGFFSAYSEGWALYAEQLADELGAYATPLERAGYLQSFLFRATRLVVDTGIHAKQWSREKATDYMVATTGFARPRTQREVERYCTQAGQACSYKVGHMAWTRARVKAKAALGSRFDLKQFHDILLEGAMPLTILERRVDERIAAIRGRT